ncbi:MAG TPA: hypothetical protein DCM05_03465 [Elusimicrobia bacterium]|nr:hypothetical protein [Elusimicrobiota bacterium]
MKSCARAPALHAVFFLSGAASLLCEAAWNRLLVIAVGNTVASAGMIVSAFMGALALGAWLGGRVLGGRRPSLLPYALLEACIGLYALSSPWLFGFILRLFEAAAPGLSPGPLQALRLVLISGFVFFPALLMGATFPAILAGGAGNAGSLYAVNTLGAALGALAAGYVLLPSYGVRTALAAACLLGWAAAGGALLAGRPAEEPPVPEAAAPEEPLSPAFPAWAAAGAFAAGFATLSYQVLMTRLSILYFGSGIAVFAVVLAAFLLGTGAGALLSARLKAGGRALASLFCLEAALGGLALAASPFLLTLLGWEPLHGLPWAQDLWIAAAVVLPTFLTGGLLPLALRLMRREPTARGAGALYALNALGGMLGAALANPLLIPALGTRHLLSLLALLLLLCAAGAAAVLGGTASRRLLASAGLLACAALACLLPYRMQELYLAVLAPGAPARILLHSEGAAATATVIDLPSHRELYLNGTEEASTRFFHVQLFKLLGFLPSILRDGPPREALMIAFGAGISAGAALDSGGISRLEVVELNRDVDRISGFFSDVNGDPLRRPELRFIADDGRNHLLRTRKRWPLIIADATHPLTYDSWILYTREFYSLLRSRLSEDGLFAQWVPMDEMPKEAFRAFVRTFLAEFPETTLWNVPGSGQSFLLATPRPLALDLPRLRKALRDAPASLQLKDYQLDDPLRLAAFLAMDSASLRAFAGKEGPMNTDDLPLHQALSLRRERKLNFGFDEARASAAPCLKGLRADDRARLAELEAAAWALRRYFSYYDPMALVEAFALSPEDGNVLYHCSREFLEGDLDAAQAAGQPRTQAELAAARRIQDYRTRVRLLLTLSPERTNYSFFENQARAHYAVREFGQARALLSRSLELYPTNTLARLNLARLLLRQGERAQAGEELRRILRENPGSIPALKLLSRLLREEGRPREAAPLERSAQALEARLRKAGKPPLYPCGEYCKSWDESWMGQGSRY